VDWVYAEELGVRSNYFWSPDGKEIAFLQMDETAVPAYPIVDWLPTHAKLDMEKYPKAGDPNPNVRIGVISSGGGKPKWISLTEEQDIYIPRFGWVRDGLLWAEVLNRTQDSMNLYFVDAHSGRSRKVLTESTPDAWINLMDDFRITDGRLVLNSREFLAKTEHMNRRFLTTASGTLTISLPCLHLLGCRHATQAGRVARSGIREM